MAEVNEEITAIDVNEMKRRLLAEQAQLLHDLEIKEHQVAENGDDLDAERGGVGNHMADDANQTFEPFAFERSPTAKSAFSCLRS